MVVFYHPQTAEFALLWLRSLSQLSHPSHFQVRDGTTFSFQPRSINLPAFQRQSALIWHDGPMRELVRESGGYNCAGLVFVGGRGGLEPTVKGQAVGRKISDRQCSRCSLLTGIAVELAPRQRFRPYTPIYFDRVLGDSGSPHLTHPADGRTRYTWKWRRWPATGQLSKATSRPLVLNVA